MVGTPHSLTAEEQRLFESASHEARWRHWGAYLSERQWGTVREDYSADGDAWCYLPFDHARSRTYRWGEDGLLGISDNHQHLCFAPTLWNGEDKILKDRLFGLSNPEGNHGEDVKECYYFLDGLPTHSLMKALYKYPQAPFPYDRLIAVNRERSRAEPEFELIDTGIFDEGRYFDVTVEYVKASPDDICIEISVTNRGPEAKRLHLLPTLWFRNTWSWGYGDQTADGPTISVAREDKELAVLEATHPDLGTYFLYAQAPAELIFTENETNWRRISGGANATPFVKDGFHDYLVEGHANAINPGRRGTKAAVHRVLDIAAGQTAVVRLRLADVGDLADALGASFDAALTERRRDADEFYARIAPYPQSEEARRIQRTAFAGMLWCQQYYHYVVHEWLEGDPTGPPVTPERKNGRNRHWAHLNSDDVLSMPDTWEYPWFASWDLAFHCIIFAMIDPDFAKRQLVQLTRGWFMHPLGELPAYEWGFGEVNPPMHAWAALRVYQIEQKMFGRTDRLFLERVFQKLLMNFTWWCNRKDAGGNNIFQGGFLGLDNISMFDRNVELPGQGRIDQADGTAWMGVYCLNMLAIAIELARDNLAYQDIASTFFEHFIHIADAINHLSGDDLGVALWDDASGFYSDVLNVAGRAPIRLVRSMVGVIPLLAVTVSDTTTFAQFPSFQKRMRWFIERRPDLHGNVSPIDQPGIHDRRILAMVDGTKLRKILAKLLDESEFLSSHGIRSLSKYYKDHRYELDIDGAKVGIDYEPAESTTDLFGGNSNWRGPVWFPLNYLIIEALQRFHYYYGDDFKVECPTGSGDMKTLWEVATELSHRLIDLFKRDAHGRRPMYGDAKTYQTDPHFRDLLFFYEYFNGDTGAGLGAIHQTGWTGIVAKLLQQCAEYGGQNKHPL